MRRFWRVVSVTLWLSAAGALFGAIAGAIALGTSLLVTDNDTSLFGVLFGALLGAPYGAATAPIVGWIALRRVPLGRLFVGLAIGTTIGGIVGWITTTSDAGFFAPEADNGLIGAFVGCLVASLILHFRARPHVPRHDRLEA
jgi:hypothetical protein